MTIAQYKLQLYRRKAAKLGMTLEQFAAYVERERERLAGIAALRTDRGAQFRAIGRKAAAYGRTMTILGGENDTTTNYPKN